MEKQDEHVRFGKDQRTLSMFDAPPPVLRQAEDVTFDSLRWYQQDAVTSIERSLEQVRSTMLTLATGLGKCLGRGTPVLRYDGSVALVEDIVVGDLLMGPDSKPRRVLSVNTGRGGLRMVRPTKGDPWVCNDVHVLTLVNSSTNAVVDVQMDAYEASSKTFKHLHKQFSVGVDFPETAPPVIDPYCIGLWIGDGSKDLNSFCITKPDAEVGEALQAIVDAYPETKLVHREPSERCASWNVVYEVRPGRGGSRLLYDMRALFPQLTIPRHYLTGSRETRLQLLAGIVDTDGHVIDETVIEVTQKNTDIANGVAFLARSLGLKVTSVLKRVNGVAYHRMVISGNTDIIPTRIPRKRLRARGQVKNALRTGFAIEDIGEGEFFGFTLDGDGRFLLGDFTVTHNTQCFSALAHRWKDGRVLVLAHREELVDQARARLEQMTGELVEVEKAELRSHKARIVVGSVQTVYREDRLSRLQKNGGFGLVIVDECHHYVSDTYQLPLEYFSGAKILGVTATPDRADGKALGKIFDDVAYSMDLRDGIDNGYLVPLKGKEVEVQEINLDRVASSNGDLNQTQLDEAMLEGVEGIVKGMLHHSGERQGLVFFPGVHCAYLAAERLNALKANCAVAVSGETPKDERKRLMDAFRNGEIQFLANCMVATEGFDAPTASVVGLARPTKSRSLYAQMVGRGTRVLPGVVEHIKGRDQAPERRAAIAASKKPGCLLIDFVGNNSRHTLMTPQDLLGGMYSEEVRKRARKDGDEEDVQEALERAAEDERKELARKDMMAAAMSITSHVKSVSRDYDPFRLLGVDIEREHKYGTEYGYKPMSDKQKALMLRQGFAESEMVGMSARTATKVISQIVERQKRGLASPKQSAVLGRAGIVDQNIKAKTASLLISHIVNTNGKIDPQVVRDLTSDEEF